MPYLFNSGQGPLDPFAGLGIDLPTPVEIAGRLTGHGFSEDQVNAIAAEVYQPLCEMLKALALRGVRR